MSTKRYTNLLAFFLAAYPFSIYPWGEVPYYTTIKSLYLLYFTLGLWLVYLYDLRNQARQPNASAALRRHAPDKALLLFASLIAISTVCSVDVLLSLFGDHLRYEGAIAFMCYLSLYYFSSRLVSPASIRPMLGLFASVSALAAVYGILQRYLLDFLPRSPNRIGSRTSYAFFDNQNFFGTFLVLTFTVSAALFLMNRRSAFAVWFLLIGGVHFAALIYSSTRGAWLGAIAALLVLAGAQLAIRQFSWKRWSLLLAALIAIFTGINASENNAFLQRAGTIVSDSRQVLDDPGAAQQAGSNRWLIWQASLPLVPQYFWIGSGPDTIRLVFPQQPVRDYTGLPNLIVDKVHNEYLQLAITLGVPALAAYLLLLALVGRSALLALLRERRKAGLDGLPASSGNGTRYTERHVRGSGSGSSSCSKNIVICCLLACAAGYLVQAFFNISVVTVAPYFWLFLGLLYRASSDSS